MAIRDWSRLPAREKREAYYELEPKSRDPARTAVRREARLVASLLTAFAFLAILAWQLNWLTGVIAAGIFLYLLAIAPMNLVGDYYTGKTAAFEALEKGGSAEEAVAAAANAVNSSRWTWGAI